MNMFFREWFGVHAGREIFRDGTREYIEKYEQLSEYVQYCTENKAPCWVSVQPFQARDQPFGLEKLYFDFDSKEDTAKAWKEALRFSENLVDYYRILPLITFSGNKGYHVYVFLSSTVGFPTFRLEFVKQVYESLQKKLLKGFKFETLDPAPLGDIKRLARVPYSVHEKTGKLCSPISLSHVFIKVSSLQVYRDFGLGTSVLGPVCKELKDKEKWSEIRSRNRRSVKFDGKTVRPCIEAATHIPLEEHGGHLMRLAIAAEYLSRGTSIDQVVELFHGQGDFGTGERSRYFVEDTQRKGYKPFRCETIRELGFCLPSCPKRRDDF